MAATWAPWPRTTPPSSWTIVPPPWTPTPQFTSPLKSDSDIHVCQTGLFLYFDLSSGFGLFYIIFELTKPRKVFALSTRTHRHTQPLHTSGYSLWVFFIWFFCPIYFRGSWVLLVCSFWVVFSFEGGFFGFSHQTARSVWRLEKGTNIVWPNVLKSHHASLRVSLLLV